MRYPLLRLFLILLFLCPAFAWAGNCAQVTVGGTSNTFSPATVHVPAGGCVTFTNVGGFHNVVSDAGAITSFRCATGCGGTAGDPAQNPWSSTVTFPTDGAAPYHCEVHGIAMSGLVNVGTTPVQLQSFDVDQGKPGDK